MPDREIPKSAAPGGENALEALRAVVEGTARAAGEALFPTLTQALCRALGVRYALIGAVDARGASVDILAAAWDGRSVPRHSYGLDGTPCGVTFERGETSFIPTGVSQRFPTAGAAKMGMDAYLGTPLFDSAGRKIGVLCVMSDHPIDLSRGPSAVLEIFAARAASEIERVRLEHHLHRSQRLEGMGRLAAGVAHDFNNLLTVVIGNAEFAYAALPAGSPVRDFISPIHDAAHRAMGLTRQLLAFSRRQPAAPSIVDLGAEVSGTTRLLGRLLGDRHPVESAAEPVWPVRIDPAQFEQVLLNLAINARDAMPAGGPVQLRLWNDAVDAARAASLGIPPGDWVHLAVTDRGAGMDEETRARCFEPFFSTKGERGTGLGLATCLGVVRQANGHIWVDSAPGEGATFHVLLPRHAGPAGAPRRAAPIRDTGHRRLAATILVAEDDPTLLEVARRALEQGGATVLAASDPREAVAIAERHPARIDALVSDLALPGLSGPELSAQLRVIRPDLRVIFVSGFADEDTISGLERTGDPILMKPFTPASLVAGVAALLGEATVPGAPDRGGDPRETANPQGHP